jgi:hypothetical protein
MVDKFEGDLPQIEESKQSFFSQELLSTHPDSIDPSLMPNHQNQHSQQEEPTDFELRTREHINKIVQDAALVLSTSSQENRDRMRRSLAQLLQDDERRGDFLS